MSAGNRTVKTQGKNMHIPETSLMIKERKDMSMRPEL